MPINVTKENGRIKIEGSETYPNGMTLTFLGQEEVGHMGRGKGERIQGLGRRVNTGGRTYFVRSSAEARNPNLTPVEATPRRRRRTIDLRSNS